MQELRNNVIEPGNLPFCDVEILLEFAGNFSGLVVRRTGLRPGTGPNRNTSAAAMSWAGSLELLDLTIHQLEVYMQRIERIADLMRDTGRQQCEGLDSFAFNRFERLLPRLISIVQNECYSSAPGGLAIQRSGVQAQ